MKRVSLFLVTVLILTLSSCFGGGGDNEKPLTSLSSTDTALAATEVINEAFIEATGNITKASVSRASSSTGTFSYSGNNFSVSGTGSYNSTTTTYTYSLNFTFTNYSYSYTDKNGSSGYITLNGTISISDMEYNPTAGTMTYSMSASSFTIACGSNTYNITYSLQYTLNTNTPYSETISGTATVNGTSYTINFSDTE